MTRRGLDADVTLSEALHALRDGRIDFAEFLRRTRRQWMLLSRTLMRRWDQPLWVDLEDVQQDFHLESWLAVGRFDAARGTGLRQFVVYNAFDKAKKRAHKARGAIRSGNDADRNPSRYEFAASALARGDEPDPLRERLERLSAVPPAQEDDWARREAVARALSVCGSVPELLAVQAVAATASSFRAAAECLYGDPDARRICRLRSEAHALRWVERVIRDVAARVQYLKA